MMVAQLNISRILGIVFGLGNVFGVQGHWLGPMPAARGLVERAGLNCSPGYVACGDLGCILENRCCNEASGWGCRVGAACYTVSGFVDCYATTNAAPTTARSCFDYTATGCPDGVGCFKCISTASPYCYTQQLVSATDVWIDCSTVAGTMTVGFSSADPTTIDSTTPAIITPAATTPATTTIPITTAPPGFPVATSASPQSSGGSSSMSPGVIAGIAIGAFAAIAVIGLLAFFLLRKSKSTQQQAQAPPGAYQPPHPPYDPNMAQYQQVVAGGTVASPVSYQGGYNYPHDQAVKAQYPQPQPPTPHQPGVMAELGAQ